MLILSEAITRQLVDADAVLAIIEDVARAHAGGRVVFPDPGTQVLLMDQPKCRYRLKSVGLPDIPVVGIRIIGYPTGGQGEKSSTRFVLLSDPGTGTPLALVDDHWTYTLRTAASAVVGLKYLAPERPLRVAMIGAGNLAGAMLMLLKHVGRLASATVTSRRPESREGFARKWAESLGVPVAAVTDVPGAAADAELLVTATDAGKKLVDAAQLRKGMTVCTLGHHELAPEIYAAADKLVLDSWDVAKGVADIKELVESGVVARERVHCELHDLVTGKKPGRAGADETIIYRTDGLVSQDVAINYVVYKTAQQRGLGVTL